MSSMSSLPAVPVRIVPMCDRHRTQCRSIAIDFEFSRLPHREESWGEWLAEVVILSIGLAPAREAKTFYAVSAITPSKVSQYADWTRDHVLPLLQARVPSLIWTTRAQLKYRLAEYLSALQERWGGPITAVADWEGDLLLLGQVMEALVPNLALADVAVDAVAPWRLDLESARHGLMRHNAVDDAVWLRRVLGFESKPCEVAARIF